MGVSVPFPNQDRPRRRSGASLIERSQPSCNIRRPTIPSCRLLQDFVGLGIQIAKAIGLDPVGKDSEQEIPGEMFRCCSSKLVLPASPQSRQIEIAQKRDLVLDCLPLTCAPPCPRLTHGGALVPASLCQMRPGASTRRCDRPGPSWS